MEIIKIAITGGPCGGKSTAISRIKEEFTKRGYSVLFVSETATELISGGITPWTCGSNAEYQSCQMKLQIEKEKVFEQGARTMKTEKVLIVCDRGIIDNKAYMTESEFADAVKALGTTEAELKCSYAAVFQLVTAAKGAESFYTTENNSARTETPEQAAELDDKMISVWAGHPYFRVVDNSTNFEGKINRLIEEISNFLENR